MDPAQYHSDLKAGGPGAVVYEGINLLIRRKVRHDFRVKSEVLGMWDGDEKALP